MEYRQTNKRTTTVEIDGEFYEINVVRGKYFKTNKLKGG